MPCTEASPPPRLQVAPEVWLDGRLALWFAAYRLLVVADLHWGYVESHRAQGNLLPAWGDAEIERRLRSLLRDYAPAEMLWLGDSLHSLAGRSAAESFLSDCEVPVTVLAGNHDARWTRVRSDATALRGQYVFHHGDSAREIAPDLVEVIGHHHPALAWSDGAGVRFKLPALVVSPRRLVLPAFSPWAAGTPWRSGSTAETVYAIGTKRIFTVSHPGRQKEPFVS